MVPPAEDVPDSPTRSQGTVVFRIMTSSQLPARGREVNGHSHRMFCCCLSLRTFPWSRRKAILHLAVCVYQWRLESRSRAVITNVSYRMDPAIQVVPDFRSSAEERADSSSVLVAKVSDLHPSSTRPTWHRRRSVARCGLGCKTQAGTSLSRRDRARPSDPQGWYSGFNEKSQHGLKTQSTKVNLESTSTPSRPG